MTETFRAGTHEMGGRLEMTDVTTQPCPTSSPPITSEPYPRSATMASPCHCALPAKQA